MCIISMNIFQLHNISFSYSGDSRVFDNIDLDVRKKDLIIIQGESGAGKSTFLKLFNRFCSAFEGELFFHEKNIREYDIERIRSSVIYLPQLPFMIHGTVRDNLAFPFSFHSHKGKEFDSKKAGEWLDYFQMDIPFDRDALQLSIGQKQRIALIRSILLEPEVLLLDEPGSSLDSNNKRLIEQKIESLIHTSGITVIMATHSEVSFSDLRVRFLSLDNGILTEKKEGS